MIEIIVRAFRAAIYVIVALSLLLSLLIVRYVGLYGVAMAIGFVIFITLALGVAATLVSINDKLAHLVIQRDRHGIASSDGHRIDVPERRTTIETCGVVALVGLLLVAVSFAVLPSDPVSAPVADANDPARVATTPPAPTRDAKGEVMCDPKLAAEIGLTCDGKLIDR